MGNKSTKSSLRNAIVILSISADPIQANDDKFWEQIWVEDTTKADEIIRGIRTQEIRMLRDGSPKNFAVLTYKMVERLSAATGTLCNTPSQQTAVINAARIMIRILPCVFEDRAWRNFFIENHIETDAETNALAGPKLIFPKKSDQERDYTSYLPGAINLCNTQISESRNIEEQTLEPNSLESATEKRVLEAESLLKTLILSICDLLFCPEFTVPSHSQGYLSNSIDGPPEDLKSLATCDYVWEPGVGFDSNINSTTYYDKSRSVLLRLLLTCLSTTLYETSSSCVYHRNHWIEVFVSKANRHALPLFTSLLNTIFSYNPTKLIPFNQFFFEDTREELVELSAQILISTLDYSSEAQSQPDSVEKNSENENLFIEYTSRIHRSEDFTFIIKGMIRLLNNRFEQGYLLGPNKELKFEQELLILNWKLCNLNKRFINHLLRTKDVLDIIIPILYHLNENFQDSSKSALMHIAVFNLLILSGERNFGVILNRAYTANSIIDLAVFTGSHADLMIVIFHKLILYGYNLNQLFDFLLTIIVNISPYLKTISMMASNCLIQLFEIFSSSSVVLTEPSYHQLVIFLLEIFNNIIQYQFDGNANLIYAIINKREVFSCLANMPTSQTSIQKELKRLTKIRNENLAKFSAAPNEALNNGNIADNSTKDHPISDGTDMNRGISLLATPDISDVTHPINPNLVPVTDKHDSSNQQPKRLELRSSSNEEKNQLLDDILAQTSTPPINVAQDSLIITIDEMNSAAESNLSSLIALTKRDDESKELHTASESADDCKNTKLADVASTSGTSTPDERDEGDERQAPIWRPTSKFLREWKKTLPLQTILRMIEVLKPQVDKLIEEKSGQCEVSEIVKFLQNGTLVGLLPVPHPILIRKYRTNEETKLWFRVCTWGVIYYRNPIWSSTEVKLIKLIK